VRNILIYRGFYGERRVSEALARFMLNGIPGEGEPR